MGGRPARTWARLGKEGAPHYGRLMTSFCGRNSMVEGDGATVGFNLKKNCEARDYVAFSFLLFRFLYFMIKKTCVFLPVLL